MRRSDKDTALGMGRAIDRCDFLNGVTLGIGALGVGALGAGPAFAQRAASWAQDQPDHYPPLLTGLRGSHPGSFEAAHR